MEYKDRILKAKETIEYNQKLIYKLSVDYKYLHQVLDNEVIRDTLLKVLSHAKRTVYIYKNKKTFTLDTKTLSKIRHKTTDSVSNKQINYLCAIGFIKKSYQMLGDTIEDTYLTNTNFEFLKNNNSKRPLNTFYIKEYTKNELLIMDARAERLIKNGVTPGNMSSNMLEHNGCKDIADEVFYANNKNSIKLKDKEFNQLLSVIDRYISRKGYTTKAEIYNSIYVNVSASEIDKLFRIYKRDINRIYKYNSPTSTDKLLYNLPQNFKKWIITRKD